MADFWRLLAGTVILRPYVFIFLTVYLIAAGAHLGWRQSLLFIPIGYGLAWLSEFTSIHWGFPYGHYFYIPSTLDKELWVLGVPFMDSLSYVFLSYCSYATALFVLSPLALKQGRLVVMETRGLRESTGTLVLGAFLFVLLDIIIDPVALLGDRWFLGRIYGYREVGLYFGIPMSNFGGWLLVGLIMIAALQRLDRILSSAVEPHIAPHASSRLRLLGPLLYLAVLAFNLIVTFWIGETFLGLVGSLIVFFPLLLVACFTRYKLNEARPTPAGA